MRHPRATPRRMRPSTYLSTAKIPQDIADANTGTAIRDSFTAALELAGYRVVEARNHPSQGPNRLWTIEFLDPRVTHPTFTPFTIAVPLPSGHETTINVLTMHEVRPRPDSPWRDNAN